MSENNGYRCGYVAIIGRPNVGKSTLLNRILGQKISITSRKPQTTRHRILGVHTSTSSQCLFVDTPGIHFGSKRALNRAMNRAATDALKEVDLVLFMVQGTRLTEADEAVLKLVEGSATPKIAIINKIDRVADKGQLLPAIERIAKTGSFQQIIPLSAQTGDQVNELLSVVEQHLPVAPALFDDEQITDRSLRFLVAEIVREKVMRQLGDEIPYGCSVEIERFESDQGSTQIHALLWVEKPAHKPIIIGKAGERLKRIGSDARQDIITLVDSPVHLQLWVKVKRGWTSDERAVRSLEYADDTFGQPRAHEPDDS
ncbi:MAG: GTPase Era [Immundisolibacteraceae bacterium]|nr:GTPase Era [Immundisolibacteraceae bacterium]